MLKTKQNAGLSLAVTYTLTQSKSIHCDYWTFSFLSMIANSVQNNDAMLIRPTSCGWFADNEKHGHDVDAEVLLIGCADVPNQ